MTSAIGKLIAEERRYRMKNVKIVHVGPHRILENLTIGLLVSKKLTTVVIEYSILINDIIKLLDKFPRKDN